MPDVFFHIVVVAYLVHYLR